LHGQQAASHCHHHEKREFAVEHLAVRHHFVAGPPRQGNDRPRRSPSMRSFQLVSRAIKVVNMCVAFSSRMSAGLRTRRLGDRRQGAASIAGTRARSSAPTCRHRLRFRCQPENCPRRRCVTSLCRLAAGDR
jgi:hypothetical protein